MITFPNIYELEIWGVYDRGVPNAERIVFKPRIQVNLGNYIVTIGFQPQPGTPATLIQNQLFWFGELLVTPPSWVFLYTGPGTPTITHENMTKEPVQSLYWGSKQTLFSNGSIVPVILRLNGIEVLNDPAKQFSNPAYKVLPPVFPPGR